MNGNQSNTNDSLFLCVYKRDWAGAMSCISNGAQINIRDGNGDTPLHYAALNNRTELVTVMATVPGMVNQQNNKGETPLHLALWGMAAESVKILIAYGASTQIAASGNYLPTTILDNLQGRLNYMRSLVAANPNNPPIPPGANPFGAPPQPYR